MLKHIKVASKVSFLELWNNIQILTIIFWTHSQMIKKCWGKVVGNSAYYLPIHKIISDKWLMAFMSAAGIVPTEPIFIFNIVVHKGDVHEWKYIPSEE